MCQAVRIKKTIYFSMLLFWLALFAVGTGWHKAQADTRRLMVFGDSLVAGYGLAIEQGFTSQLQNQLDKAGFDITVLNAGVSGDTSAGGAARLNWALSEQPDYVMIVLGGNDMLRGLNPDQTKENLDKILADLASKNIKVLLCGMLAPANLGAEYSASFNALYPELAQKYQTAFYPFFLEDVALIPAFNQTDGLHPNAAGVAKIIEKMMPVLDRFLRDEAKI
jgi:acyl-CoA thioesterase-1